MWRRWERIWAEWQRWQWQWWRNGRNRECSRPWCCDCWTVALRCVVVWWDIICFATTAGDDDGALPLYFNPDFVWCTCDDDYGGWFLEDFDSHGNICFFFWVQFLLIFMQNVMMSSTFEITSWSHLINIIFLFIKLQFSIITQHSAHEIDEISFWLNFELDFFIQFSRHQKILRDFPSLNFHCQLC